MSSWKSCLIGTIFFTAFALLWTFWSAQALENIEIQFENPQNKECSFLVKAFLQILHYGYMTMCWLPIAGACTYGLGLKVDQEKSRLFILISKFIKMTSICFCGMWFFLMALPWMTVVSENRICDEASNIVNSYLASSSALTSIVFIGILYKLMFQKFRPFAPLSEEIVV